METREQKLEFALKRCIVAMQVMNEELKLRSVNQTINEIKQIIEDKQ